MKNLRSLVKKTYRHFMADSLYRNSIFLLMAGLINGGFSFIFWVLAAHIYTQPQVGRATALISAVSLVASASTLGLNNSLINFLPKSKDKNKLLNNSYTTVAVAALFAALIFILLLPIISSSLSFIRGNLIYVLLLIVFVVSMAINTIIDNNFTAYRSTQYTLIKNIIINCFELLFLFVFMGQGSLGLFAAYGVSFFLITLLGFYILINKFSYRPRPLIDTVILKNTASFSMANYLVSFLNGLPALLLPIIVTNSLGAKLNSVYYISYSMASLLFIIPLGIGNALFAEGSQSELNLKHIIRRAAYLNAIIMIPSIAFIIVIAPFVFLFFGHQYSIDGIAVLRILALSSLFLAISYPCGSILNIMHRLKSLIIVNFLGATSVICIVEVMIRRKGSLSSVALGWLIGWAIYSLLYIVAVRNAFYKTAVTTR